MKAVSGEEEEEEAGVEDDMVKGSERASERL